MRWRIATAVLLVAAVLPVAHTTASTPTTVPDLGSLADRGREIAGEVARQLQVDDALRPPQPGTRVAVVSSGVDTKVLPESLRPQVTGATQDAMGYGTYAATALLQIDPTMKITSLSAFAGKNFSVGKQAQAFDWLTKNAKNLDAVFYAVPGSVFLDPVSAAMEAGEWRTMTRIISDHAVETGSGLSFGLPMSGKVLDELVRDLPESERKLVQRYRSLVASWTHARTAITSLVAAGIPVVAPAGDFGPHIQTVFGLANMAEIVTVGGASGDRVSARSSSGPAIDGTVKPDLVAPTGLVGVFPEQSEVAHVLAAQNLLDPNLKLAWPAGEPHSDARARLDSSMTPAAIVAAGMASMKAQGVGDVAVMRGALTAASTPMAHEPVWRQGAGKLRFLPSAHFARSRPLVLGHGSLGPEPDGGAWRVSIPVIGGGPTGGSSRMEHFAGVGPDGGTTMRGLRANAAQQPAVSVSNGGVELTLPLGNDRYEGGLYCGYSNISVPGSSGEISPGVAANGIPAGSEQVPTCFVEGSRLRTFGFYIHDMPAENLTHALMPDLPVAGSLVRHALMILPVDPFATKLYFRVTGQDGFADFPNVIPGFYRLRQFSDYGAPVETELVDEQTRSALPVSADLGEKAAYQEIDALVLSPVCTRQIRSAAQAEAGDPCSERFLKDRFGDENVTFNKPTGTFVVKVGPHTQHIAFDFMKKMPGPAVTSRYIDLLSQKDFEYLSAEIPATKPLGAALDRLRAERMKSWHFSAAADGGVDALYNPGGSLFGGRNDQLGIARYPFALTTPNYKMHMSLNFAYELKNSVIAVLVQIGDEVAVGAVTPVGSLQTPTVGPFTPLTLDGLRVSGEATGLANFEFNMLPRGASEGVLYFVFAPPPGLAAPIASASISDISFELDTWVNPLWPPIGFGEYGKHVQGHSFTVDPNYSARQMSSDTCRQVSSGGGTSSTVCEDWTVMVHSPKHDAATFDIWDMKSKRSLLADAQSAGLRYFDPKRGVHDFSWRIAHNVSSVAELDVQIPMEFKTNGRFWEQISLPKRFLAAYPDPFVFRIVDNHVGSQSGIFGRVAEPDGSPVQVAPYVPFVSTGHVLRVDGLL